MAQIPESHRDLLDSCQVTTLATVGGDGFPQVTAVWFALDGDCAPLMSLNTARQKVRNLERHPECSLLFIDPENPYRTLEIRARAEIQPAPDYETAGEIRAKYGADLRTRDQPGESRVAVRFTPVKINTFG